MLREGWLTLALFFVFISNIKVNPKHIFFSIVKRRKWRKITLYLS